MYSGGLVLLCCALLGGVHCWSSVPVYEVNALYSLYVSTHGNFWTYNVKQHEIDNGGKPWNFSLPVEDTDPCVEKWFGIVCTSSAEVCINHTCSITQLYMSSFNMTGNCFCVFLIPIIILQVLFHWRSPI